MITGQFDQFFLNILPFMCSIIKCLWVLHFIIDLFRFTRWWPFRFYNPLDAHWTIEGLGMTISWQDNKILCQSTAGTSSGSQNTVHPRATQVLEATCGFSFLLLYPLAQDNHVLNHPITLLWGHVLPIQVSQAGSFLAFCQRSVAGFSSRVSVVLYTLKKIPSSFLLVG